LIPHRRDVLLDAFTSHVLEEGDRVTGFEPWECGRTALVRTRWRRYTVEVRADWLLIGREPWVDAVLVATRMDQDLCAPPDAAVLLVRADGGVVRLDDAGAVAELGRRVHADLDPVAYADVLARFHPASRDGGELIRASGHLWERFWRPALPGVEVKSRGVVFRGRRVILRCC
jgi:hypothetical protein